MNLFNDINKSYMTGMMLPAAAVLTFSALILTLGYMDRILNKKMDIDFRIAKVKARLNAESGIAITISGPTENGLFVPSIGSAAWPVISDEDIDVYEANFIDSETFFEAISIAVVPASNSLTVLSGKVIFIIRQNDGTYTEIESSPETPNLIQVPKNFASAHINISNNVSRVLAIADLAWRPNDNEMENISFEDYDWKKWEI